MPRITQPRVTNVPINMPPNKPIVKCDKCGKMTQEYTNICYKGKGYPGEARYDHSHLCYKCF